jgi:hypothetical protein
LSLRKPADIAQAALDATFQQVSLEVAARWPRGGRARDL